MHKLPTPFLFLLEHAINATLAVDQQTLKKLQAYRDKVVAIEISDWDVTIFLTPQPQGVQLFADYHREADTLISGKLFNLMHVGIQGGNTDALFENKIEIRGDTEFGEKIRQLLAESDFDWEEQLSRFLGDGLANQVAGLLRKTVRAGKQSAQSLQASVNDYLVEETQLLATQTQTQALQQQIATLRDDVERAEARLNRLCEQG